MQSMLLVAVLLGLNQADAWCWECSAYGTRGWWDAWALRDCTCQSGWEGECCDAPTVCSASLDVMCPQDKMIAREGMCSDLSATSPLTLGTAAMGLPESMQGVFWLTEQGDSSALMTFGTSNDGAGLSVLDLEQKNGYGIEVRVGGDKVWSFHDQATSWGLVAFLDLIYKFQFETAEGGAPDPANNGEDIAAAQIIPTSVNLGIDLTATNLLNFRAELAPKGSHSTYPNSVVWGRPSSVLGFEGGYYDLVQVIDGDGNKLQPAYNAWVAYCGSSETGGTPGTFHWREATTA